MDKYKLRHKILGELQKYMQNDPIIPDQTWKSSPELSKILKIKLPRIEAQLDYLKKQNEVAYNGSAVRELKSTANLDGYISYWDDKYLIMRSEHLRKKWGEVTQIASAILIMILNILLILNFFNFNNLHIF